MLSFIKLNSLAYSIRAIRKVSISLVPNLLANSFRISLCSLLNTTLTHFLGTTNRFLWFGTAGWPQNCFAFLLKEQQLVCDCLFWLEVVVRCGRLCSTSSLKFTLFFQRYAFIIRFGDTLDAFSSLLFLGVLQTLWLLCLHCLSGARVGLCVVFLSAYPV